MLEAAVWVSCAAPQAAGQAFPPNSSTGRSRWEQVVDLTYSLRLGAKPRSLEQDDAAVEKLRYRRVLLCMLCHVKGERGAICASSLNVHICLAARGHSRLFTAKGP